MVWNYADSFLGPHRLLWADTGFNVFLDKLVEEQTCAVNTGAINLGQDKAKRLWDLVIMMKLDSWREAELRN
jgi:hypothetical protein